MNIKMIVAALVGIAILAYGICHFIKYHPYKYDVAIQRVRLH